MSKEKTIGEIFKDGIPKFSRIRVYHRNSKGRMINTRIPRREWWRYEKCVPEDVLRGIDGSITVYVNEKARGGSIVAIIGEMNGVSIDDLVYRQPKETGLSRMNVYTISCGVESVFDSELKKFVNSNHCIYEWSAKSPKTPFLPKTDGLC